MIRKRHIVYWSFGALSLGLLAFEAPRGGALTTTPDRGQVEKGAPSARGTPVFIWAGGGYHGGK